MMDVGTTGGTRTPEEVASLKASWENDPVWDLENTDGFEAHGAQLKAHRLAMEASWAEARVAAETAAASAKAEALGCPGNLALARHVIALERRLDAMQASLDRLRN